MFDRKREQANWGALWQQMEALREEIAALTELVQTLKPQPGGEAEQEQAHAANMARQWERFWAYTGEAQEKGEG